MVIGCVFMKLIEILSRLTSEILNRSEFKDKARKKSTDFTRTRKMPFEELMIFMLQSLKCSTSSALRHFFKDIDWLDPENKWKNLAGIGMITSTRQKIGSDTLEPV